MRLDFERTWTDASSMLRANIDALGGVAGMFILLPGILSSWLLPDFNPPREATTADLAAYMEANWAPILANGIAAYFGALAILALLLHRSRPTVAVALRLALLALPLYVLANLCQSLIVASGLFFFILPGVYLAARFICLAPVAAVEGPRGPVAMLVRSFRLTRGNGWRIALMLFVMLLVAVVIFKLLSTVTGIVGMLLLPPDLARLLGIVVASLMQTALALVITLVSGAIYRQAILGEAAAGRG